MINDFQTTAFGNVFKQKFYRLVRSHIYAICKLAAGRFMIWTFENFEDFLDLQELECASCTPAFLLCFSVVYIPLVLGGFAHSPLCTYSRAPQAKWLWRSLRPCRAAVKAFDLSRCAAQQRAGIFDKTVASGRSEGDRVDTRSRMLPRVEHTRHKRCTRDDRVWNQETCYKALPEPGRSYTPRWQGIDAALSD